MNSDRESARRGPDEPNDFAEFLDDAALVARIRASYAGAPSPDAAQVARCTTAVLAEALHTPTHRFGGALRPRWWGDHAFVGAAPAAATPVGATTASGDAVRFDLMLPNAVQEVALVGDFNGWDEHATPMVRRRDDGAWSAKVPLSPGRHVYAFVIDGRRWLVDPLAPQVPDGGYGPANAVIVDGPR